MFVAGDMNNSRELPTAPRLDDGTKKESPTTQLLVRCDETKVPLLVLGDRVKALPAVLMRVLGDWTKKASALKSGRIIAHDSSSSSSVNSIMMLLGKSEERINPNL